MPGCGGLECLCRPRFFAGQLLTEEDLNRLERYVVDKNRLHNRYLHGWGVVCGLEVVCDPCGSGHVIVRTGYALSPCGDDIVVCKDALGQRLRADQQMPDAARRTTAIQPYAAGAAATAWTESSAGCSRSATTSGRRAASPRLRGAGDTGLRLQLRLQRRAGLRMRRRGRQAAATSCGVRAGRGRASADDRRPAVALLQPAMRADPDLRGLPLHRLSGAGRPRESSFRSDRHACAGLSGADYERFGPLVTRVLGCFLRLEQIRQEFRDAGPRRRT